MHVFERNLSEHIGTRPCEDRPLSTKPSITMETYNITPYHDGSK